MNIRIQTQGQNELIFNIARGAKTNNVFVVGDDDQIIYSFQGQGVITLKLFKEIS